ncbi:polycomb complex protein BMI-1-like isoform X2 [Xenia sp. Carnegie-2017]|uniref:polycomb complex protein BMI-1-like isoform X2 n=1 Tax=Xenia sp. Carnegie-2017 TaxID=2897299 RepID=UPI001F042481|nr:polycomb complex protein BMI-1-like isoform X2 [Xenia sp. Carnegie-2017]
MLPTLKIADINKNITCPLCKGYLIDACTIVECLHSFCKSCIVRYLESSYDCPVCNTEVHKTKPLVNVRPDPTLQDIVYKMVPDLYEKECLSRNTFQTNEKCKENHGDKNYNIDALSKKKTTQNSDAVYVTLHHHQRNVLKNKQRKIFPTRYLRCSKHVPVRVLKKLIEMKFDVKRKWEVEITRCDEILSENLSLKEISRIYGLHEKHVLDSNNIQFKYPTMSKTILLF